VMLTNINQT